MNSHRRSASRTGGFALMLVLTVLMTTSLIMLGMYQALQLQTRESLARQRLAVNRSLADAAFERAVVMLLKEPHYEGDAKFETPPRSGRVSVLSVHPSKTDNELIEVTSMLYVDTSQTSVRRTLSRKDIERRRTDLRL
ncbi:MAG: hypothetical protein ABI557_00855 [Aureliella sp.]